MRLTTVPPAVNEATADLMVMPPLPLERQGVRLCRPRVDAAGCVDDAGRVEQPLRQRRLARVNMGEYPEIQCAVPHESDPSNR
jgi:hypothetical protein